MTAIPVTVRILEKEYTVACPEGEREALDAAVTRVDEEMRRVRASGKVLGTDRIAVMVALNLANELMLCKQNLPDGGLASPDNLQRIESLSRQMDTALARYSG